MGCSKGVMQEELEYIKNFIAGGGFDEEIACDQLICLWTAYCLRHALTPDTQKYDTDLMLLWSLLVGYETDPSYWGIYDEFYNSMSKFLV